MNKLEYPAHVDHPVQHSDATGSLVFGALGVVIGVTIVVLASPEALTVGLVLSAAPEILAQGQLGGKLGQFLGGFVDTFSPASVAGHIIHGYEAVMLGKDHKPAARADPVDTIADCDGNGRGFEGSKIVMLGKEHDPMSRRGDHLKCAGVISDGIHSVFVGGPSSKEGVVMEETERPAVTWFGYILDSMDLGSSVLKKEGLLILTKGVGLAAELGGNKELSDAVNLGSIRNPGNVAEGVQTARDLWAGTKAVPKVLGGGSEGASGE